jgi:hypothetical protein
MEVFILQGCPGAFLLTFINTVRKVGLDVRCRYPVLYETRVVIGFRIFLTKIEDGAHNFRIHIGRALKVRPREGICNGRGVMSPRMRSLLGIRAEDTATNPRLCLTTCLMSLRLENDSERSGRLIETNGTF